MCCDRYLFANQRVQQRRLSQQYGTEPINVNNKKIYVLLKKEINVGAIILAPGIEPFDPKVREEYRYGEFTNVITSLDFERLLSSTGPFQGEVKRPSDGKHPKKSPGFSA